MGVLRIKETSLDVIADSSYDSEAAVVKELNENYGMSKNSTSKNLINQN